MEGKNKPVALKVKTEWRQREANSIKRETEGSLVLDPFHGYFYENSLFLRVT